MEFVAEQIIKWVLEAYCLNIQRALTNLGEKDESPSPRIDKGQ